MLIIDAEGNSDQCVDVPEINEFLRVKTKDTRAVMDIVDQVAAGQVKFPDGSPVETVAIDSASVLWSVQQEVASKSAEKRAEKYNKSKDEASLTQLDWVLAKRPLKRLSNRFNGTNVKFLILIGREKDLYEEVGTELKRTGVTADVMKGTEYDMNVALHFQFDKEGKWFYEVTKVQGALGEIFPMNGKGTKFPVSELLKYSQSLKPDNKVEKDEEDIAAEIVKDETMEKTWASMLEYAKRFEITQDQLGGILKEAGFTGFQVANWDAMMMAINEFAAANKA